MKRVSSIEYILWSIEYGVESINLLPRPKTRRKGARRRRQNCSSCSFVVKILIPGCLSADHIDFGRRPRLPVPLPLCEPFHPQQKTFTQDQAGSKTVKVYDKALKTPCRRLMESSLTGQEKAEPSAQRALPNPEVVDGLVKVTL
jgi:hypothetical protein